jgi:Bifunctional DNA primase/polymerase, N-terminal
VIDAARTYLARGWYSIPVPFRGKAPTITGWQDLRLDEAQLSVYFNGAPSNIGVLLGLPSGGLVDIDLDCREAIMLADRFLPPRTPSSDGRANLAVTACTSPRRSSRPRSFRTSPRAQRR